MPLDITQRHDLTGLPSSAVTGRTGYESAAVREEVETAGFVLDAESTVLANKDDPHSGYSILRSGRDRSLRLSVCEALIVSHPPHSEISSRKRDVHLSEAPFNLVLSGIGRNAPPHGRTPGGARPANLCQRARRNTLSRYRARSRSIAERTFPRRYNRRVSDSGIGETSREVQNEGGVLGNGVRHSDGLRHEGFRAIQGRSDASKKGRGDRRPG
jgi:hypothetical protein